jgi:hypothetical protein
MVRVCRAVKPWPRVLLQWPALGARSSGSTRRWTWRPTTRRSRPSSTGCRSPVRSRWTQTARRASIQQRQRCHEHVGSPGCAARHGRNARGHLRSVPVIQPPPRQRSGRRCSRTLLRKSGSPHVGRGSHTWGPAGRISSRAASPRPAPLLPSRDRRTCLRQVKRPIRGVATEGAGFASCRSPRPGLQALGSPQAWKKSGRSCATIECERKPWPRE